ncbi:MAG: hypothetical protein DVB28_001626 [Verrucomicrobia bacterium]|nr:MAG: hypothetical protein DVB28_001626 [Verrucomicrobiota bacterium]
METHTHADALPGDHTSEENRIERVIQAHIKELLSKRKDVLSKVQSELDDIDRALRHLGHEPTGTPTGASGKQKRRAKVTDSEIKSMILGFLTHGEFVSGAEILKRTGIKASRFANFKVANKGFLASKGAKRAMKYSLA